MKISIFSKKIACLFFTLLIVSPSFVFLSIPKKSEAQVPVIEVGQNLVQNTISAVQNTLTAKATTWLSFIKEASLDGVIWVLKETIIKTILNMVLKFLRTGFDGAPTYITNRQELYVSEVDNAAQGYFYNLDNIIDSIPAGSLNKYLLEMNARSIEREMYQTDTAYLVTPPSSDFPGGKAGFDEFTQTGICRSASGNPYDCLLVATDQRYNPLYLREQIVSGVSEDMENALEIAKEESIEADGFHSFRECVHEVTRTGGSAPICLRTLQTLPGQIIVDQAQEYLQAQMKELNQADELAEVIAAIIQGLVTNWMSGTL